MLVLGLTLLPFNPPAMADETKPLPPQSASQSIKSLLDKPPFKNPETVTRYRFGEEKPVVKNKAHSDGKLPAWLQALLDNLNSNTFKPVAQGLEVLL